MKSKSDLSLREEIKLLRILAQLRKKKSLTDEEMATAFGIHAVLDFNRHSLRKFLRKICIFKNATRWRMCQFPCRYCGACVPFKLCMSCDMPKNHMKRRCREIELRWP